MTPRQHAARTLLEHHKRDLQQVIAEDAFSCTTARARGLLAAVTWELAQPPMAMELALSEWGDNARGRQVDDVCADAAIHRRRSAEHVDMREAAE